jgi:hypothetical protein
MSIPDTTGLGLEDDEMQRRAGLYGQLGPSQSANGPLVPPPRTPNISGPSANDKTPPLTLRGITPPPNIQQRTSADEAEAKRIQDTGSGISQIQHGSKEGGIGIAKPHPILGAALRGLDVLGSAIAPGVMANIPGTELHHEQLGQGARARIGSDVEEQGKEATTRKANADAAATENPQPGVKTDDQQVLHDLMTGNPDRSGTPRVNPDTKQPYSYLEAFEAVKGAGQKAPPVNEADKPLANLAQFNQALGRRFQVLHPGEQLPPEYTLAKGATNGEYARISQSMTGEEAAVGTKSARDSTEADRKEARSQREPDREESRQDKLTRQADQDSQKHQALRDKFVEPLQGAIDNADYQKSYADGNAHTGTGDYQMMLQLQEAIIAGQKSGIRFNTAEQARIEHAQDLANSLRAKWGHLTGGTYFSDDQRHEIADAMQHVALIHKQAISRWDREHGGGGAQPGLSGGGGAQGGNGKTLSTAAIQQAAKDHGVSVEEATRQAKKAGYNVQ